MQDVTKEYVASLLPERPLDAHKGTFGHVFIIAGSRGFTGAPKPACEGALRSGVGLVTVGFPESLAPCIVPFLLEAMWFPLPATYGDTLSVGALSPALEFASTKQAVVLGPGLSRTPATTDFVLRFVKECPKPLLIDADGLNCLSENPDVLRERKGSSCLTPHPGEMARLLRISTSSVQGDRAGTAAHFAQQFNCVVVLKGRHTIIATPDGGLFCNPTGNPGMASGGTGDVLSGIIGGSMAQGVSMVDAAVLGVYVHGLAGDLAAERVTGRAMLARDLLDAMPDAWRCLESKA